MKIYKPMIQGAFGAIPFFFPKKKKSSNFIKDNKITIVDT